MAEHSKIEWTDHTFNPWIGCTKVSPACDHCYAEAQDRRFNPRSGHWGPHADRRRTSAANWRKPLKWDREAAKAGTSPRVFCASLADVFDNHRSIAPEWRRDLYRLIEDTPHLDWLLLTKRPQNFAKLAPARWVHDGCPPNVWIGTTVENQAEADRRIPHLLSIPARVRFLSCEPLLGPVDLTRWLWGREKPCDNCPQDVDCECGWEPRGTLNGEAGLSWIIAGGESGTGARPSNPQWFRDLRDQCAAADVPFHFKQWGEWHPGDGMGDDIDGSAFGCFDDADRWVHPVQQDFAATRQTMFRIGKSRAGRTLDGVTHDGMPG
ncbi:phage Gp37/Gp68 family protein [Mameliella sp. CS4]|uniref:DUF5131 family protein n=1 Tax=Mameliella sp. CS4 TaxID=2862329 RepID=UPI001C5EEA0A|nr:phage Gp37/Gp68 family protein [Mameliella sp. CS4]MBW4983702.1 phage Gp37/Gp68 family protein [Mameliella sp. CS4]